MRWPIRLSRQRDTPAQPHDRFPPAAVGNWTSNARDDPITGLVAWPGFYADLPRRLAAALTNGRFIGLAIGDVDHLKDYVEQVRAADAESFGHLAGNAVMTRLGTVARHWLWSDGPTDACLATFGGDEIILIAEVPDEPAFEIHVCELRTALCDTLPCTVSFGATIIRPDSVPTTIRGDHWWAEFATQAIGRVEQTLFAHKHARGSTQDQRPRGFVEFTSISGRTA